MPTAEKSKAIARAQVWYRQSSGVVFSDYRGLKVKELQALRSHLREKGGELHVLKNTLFRRAAGQDTTQMDRELHNGPTAFTFVFENEAEVAKALLDYAKTNKKLVIKGGFFDGKSLSPKEVESLSQLPSREVLIAQIIGLIATPMSNLISTVESLYADPIRLIAKVAEKIEAETEADNLRSSSIDSNNLDTVSVKIQHSSGLDAPHRPLVSSLDYPEVDMEGLKGVRREDGSWELSFDKGLLQCEDISPDYGEPEIAILASGYQAIGKQPIKVDTSQTYNTTIMPIPRQSGFGLPKRPKSVYVTFHDPLTGAILKERKISLAL